MNKAISDLQVALAGNPNCGKTVIFNALTGAKQKVGNWPGVTVERKYGQSVFQKQNIKVVDLPGSYALHVHEGEMALDQRIACQYFLSEKVDVVVNVIDASNLERNLYFTMQLLEMDVPVVLAVNMMDVLEKRGLQLDLKKLSALTGCMTVGLVARQNKGIDALKSAIVKAAKSKAKPKRIPLLAALQKAQDDLAFQLNNHWLAVRLLEGDTLALEQADAHVKQHVAKLQTQIQHELGEEIDILLADARYHHIHEMVLQVRQIKRTGRKTGSQFVDRIVLNQYVGVPIFFIMMYFMFVFAIGFGGAFQDFFDLGSTAIFVHGTAKLLMHWHVPDWIVAILANGIGKGMNTTITFVPVIGAMFLFLSFLEDSGYMARAAFVMDRCMRALGLPGKSFVPMIVGFGCNVPAVMGARTLAQKRDRILTVMMMPFMSCGARLAIFAVFAAAFFPVGGAEIIFLLYILGIVVAVLFGWLLRKTLLQGEPTPMVMELPPYHLPRVGILFRHTWQRLKSFLKRAGKVIIPVCILIGALNSISISGQLLSEENGGTQSILSEVGRVVTPVFTPMGVHEDNWPATVGLATGILAKEVVIGTLNTLYSQSAHLAQKQAVTMKLSTELKQAIASIPANLKGLTVALSNPFKANEASTQVSQGVYGIMAKRFHTDLAAFAYLLFVLLYFPCISTLAVMRREVGKRWASFSMAWSMLLAYGLAVMVYQVGQLRWHPWLASGVMGSVMLFFVVCIWLMAYVGRRQNAKLSGLQT